MNSRTHIGGCGLKVAWPQSTLNRFGLGLKEASPWREAVVSSRPVLHSFQPVAGVQACIQAVSFTTTSDYTVPVVQCSVLNILLCVNGMIGIVKDWPRMEL